MIDLNTAYWYSLVLDLSDIQKWLSAETNRETFGLGFLENGNEDLGRLGSQGSKGKKSGFENSEQLLRVVFSTFCGQKKNIFFKILKGLL